MKSLTIREKITILFVSLFLVLSSLFSLFMYNYLSRILYQEEEKIIKNETSHAITHLGISRGNIEGLYIFKTYELISPSTNLAIIDLHGNMIPGETEPDILVYPIESNVFREVDVEVKSKWYFYDEPIYYDNQVIGWIRISRSLTHITETLNNIKIVIFTAIPIYIFFTSLISLFLASRALSPIDSITKTAELIERGNLSRRIKMPKVNDEVGRLAKTFNRMIGRLETAFKKERQFTADASHELRTPLAVISAHSQEALAKGGSIKDYREALEIISNESRRLSFLISQLLQLARSDEKRNNLNIERLDLKIVTEDVLNEMKDSAGKKDIKITLDSGPIMEINADQTLMTMLFLNIIDNAIKYNKRGGSIKVSLRKENNVARILIEDSGIGISGKYLPKIFDRFFRVDKARTDKSSGLGLSIIKGILDVHGGNIKVDSTPGKGTTFKITLPLNL